MKISDKEIAAVVELPAPKRYGYFVKKVVDSEQAWGLYKDGWALAGTKEGQTVFPLWPAREYASQCATDLWVGYEPEEIPLDDLLTDLLPMLSRDGVLPGVFYTPKDKGVLASAEELRSDLEEELQAYE